MKHYIHVTVYIKQIITLQSILADCVINFSLVVSMQRFWINSFKTTIFVHLDLEA